MLVNAIGGTWHPTGSWVGKLGWWWKEALSQLHDTWPRCPHFHCLVSQWCPSMPWYLLAPCQHLRDLSVSCTAPETWMDNWITSQTIYKRATKEPGLIQPFVCSVDFNDFQRSRKGKCSMTPGLFFRCYPGNITHSQEVPKFEPFGGTSLAYLDSAKILKRNGSGFSRDKQIWVLLQVTYMFSDEVSRMETWLIPHLVEMDRLGAPSR